MMRILSILILSSALIGSVMAQAGAPAAAPASLRPDRGMTKLVNPIVLRAGGELIDVTTGHAAPYVLDLDGDGVRDLLVGEYGSGRFPAERLSEETRENSKGLAEGRLRFYRNVGTNTKPRYEDFEYLKDGDENLSLPVT